MKFDDAIKIPGVAQIALESARIDFEESADAWLPWHAIRIATTAGVDVPEWVLGYFSDRAKLINEIIKAAGPDEAKEIGAALGFGGAGRGSTSTGGRARNQSRNWAIALKMEEEINSGAGIDAAAMIAAKDFNVSKPTAYSAHDKFGSRARDYIRARRAGA
ncbi:hypothetical protein [Bradyrhizobium sp. Tv2a-2]|uniref:hypothetical protein n=1 Tax=Bradyrhizobium sp. Tv2a-2 TaxID=113395 RepID=UPI000405045A|nr:hypothetical protein [Bradyrhizobium sp. Tv2a-2]